MQKDDVIYRQDAIDAIKKSRFLVDAMEKVIKLPPAKSDYAELKREFILMASYIDVLLECSDEQKETLMGFISRLSERMPWIEKD